MVGLETGPVTDGEPSRLAATAVRSSGTLPNARLRFIGSRIRSRSGDA